MEQLLKMISAFVAQRRWITCSKSLLSPGLPTPSSCSVVLRLPFHESSALCLWIHPVVPEAWLCGCCLSPWWHSAALVRPQLCLWRVLGPQSKTGGQQTADSVVVLIPCRAATCSRQREPPCRDTGPWDSFNVTSDFQFSVTVPQFSNKFGSMLVVCGIIKVDPFCRASRKKIHYCMRRSERAKVENICVPSTAV